MASSDSATCSVHEQPYLRCINEGLQWCDVETPDNLPEMRGAWEPAITQHEIMLAYIEAGFTRPEAVYITTAISLGHPGSAPTHASHDQALGEQT